MDRERWRQVRRIFEEARELARGERDAYLREACGDDAGLRAEVDSLVAHGEQGEELLNRSQIESLLMAFYEPDSQKASLEAGTRLGVYEVVGPLGKGGMGEVYRARDTKLEREIAIKVLPAQFSLDKDRLVRFEREAKLLAQLNHPGIATLYGLEKSDAIEFLTMELVEGETLAERISRSPTPIDEALALFKQIADSVEAAHEKGIVHRDLKPANIKITPDGKVKVLDFGLAKAFVPEGEDVADASKSPIVTKGSALGAIMGTAAYMSPEQARGKPVDKRADIWAFGCCLYESLSGRKAFPGETVTDTIAAVLQKEPDWAGVPARTPPKILELMRRALTKEPIHRLRDIGDARIEIEEAIERPFVEAHGESILQPFWRRTIPRALLTLGAVLLGFALGNLEVLERPGESASDPIRSLIALPEGTMLAGHGSPVVALSPDGKKLAIVAVKDGVQQLFVRHLDRLEAELVPGSEDAEGPFFSPDSRWVGFAVGVSRRRLGDAGELRRVSVDGGLPQTLSEIYDYFGASWGEDGFIYFVDRQSDGLWKLRDDGGEPEVISGTEGRSFLWPQVLPGNRAVLARGPDPEGGIQAIDLSTGESKDLGLTGYIARFSPTGHILYAGADAALLAAPFDPARLEITGPSMLILEHVALARHGAAVFSISRTGSLVYTTGYLRSSERELSQLVWLGGQGTSRKIPMEPDTFTGISLSADGVRVAATTWDGSLWVYDLRRNTRIKLPQGDVFEKEEPQWTPDGLRVAFSGKQKLRGSSGPDLFWQSSDGIGLPELLLERPGEQYPASFTPDGLKLGYYTMWSAQTVWDIEVLRMEDPRTSEELLVTPAGEMYPRISPDGRGIAYASNETGRFEIYVQPFPELTRKFSVSVEGGGQPRWSPDGKKLFYRNGNRWMAVPFETENGIEPGRPRLLFEADGIWDYDVGPGGQELIAISTLPDSGIQTELQFVQNWFQELNRLVPTN